jgi:hypothetical protein
VSSAEDGAVRVGNRYRLDERIGAGAMGAVWRATDELLNRTVAVKELLAAASTGADALEESRQRLLREGRIGARLQHAHVISMFDVVVYEDRPWLVMEYLPSKSCAQLLGQKGPLPPRDVADIGRQVADGLAAAHLAGVVHRDVKPGNVLIAKDGLVKLTDFGVSRAVDDVQLTRTGLIAGTPAYLAPEVARGQDPTAASDVFALGATLYAAIEGTPPFGLDDNAYALLHKVATAAVRTPEHDGPVMDVIMRLLSREPEDRPSAAQARDALAAVASGRDMALAGAAPAATGTAVLSTPLVAAPAAGGTTPMPPSTAVRPASAPPPRRRRSMRRVLVIGVAAVLAMVLGGVIAVLNRDNTGSELPPVAQPGTTAPAAPTTTPPPTTTAPPVTTTVAPPPAGGSDAVAFVQGYYALLPGDTESAWQLLGPAARQASGGRSGYDNFYAGIRSVSVENTRAVGDGTVQGTVVFTTTDGTTTREAYRFVLGTSGDGRTIMQSFSRA